MSMTSKGAAAASSSAAAPTASPVLAGESASSTSESLLPDDASLSSSDAESKSSMVTVFRSAGCCVLPFALRLLHSKHYLRTANRVLMVLVVNPGKLELPIAIQVCRCIMIDHEIEHEHSQVYHTSVADLPPCCQLGPDRLPLSPKVRLYPEPWRPAAQLSLPVLQERRGGHDQVRTGVALEPSQHTCNADSG